MKMLRIVGITAAIVAGTTVFAIALGGLGIWVIKNPFPQNATIYLTQDLSGSKLVIDGESGNLGKCETPRKPGCVGVSKWRKANIRFRLVNMDGWIFKQIQLVAAPLPKLDFGTQTPALEPEMKDDFYVKINNIKIYPDDNGIIDLAGLQPGYKFKLVDRNNFTQNYSYQIEACNEGVCLPMDPMIENEGKK